MRQSSLNQSMEGEREAHANVMNQHIAAVAQKQAIIPTEEHILKIAGCPCDIDKSYFETCFLEQIQMLNPEAFRKMKPNSVEMYPGTDLLQEITISIEFDNIHEKKKAVLKLKDCIYRQDEDPNYIFSIMRVNDEGQGEMEHRRMQDKMMDFGVYRDQGVVMDGSSRAPSQSLRSAASLVSENKKAFEDFKW